MCLVLTRFLEGAQPWMLAKLQMLIGVWTDVLGELLEGMDDRSQEYVTPFPCMRFLDHFWLTRS
jgi:hypothetical protein